MRLLYWILVIPFIYSCAETKEKKGAIAINFPYTNQMMDNSIEKGKSYKVIPQTKYEPNQIIVFDYDDKLVGKTMRMAYRIVGIPGDTINIIQGKILRNGKVFPLPPTAKYHYLLYLKEQKHQLFDEFDIEGSTYSLANDAFLTRDDSIRLMQKYGYIIDSFIKRPLGYNYQVLLNYQNTFGWNPHNFGPVPIPAKGSSVSVAFARTFLNDIKQEQLTSDKFNIVQNYYYVIGDNFDNCSSDSRGIGLISQSQIVGTLQVN